MKSRSAFEERLISHSSESTLKNAKQLLKNNLISGAFRDADNVLHAVFADKNSVKNHVHLELGERVRYQCDCAEAGNDELCMHAIALWMYSGLFRVPEKDALTTDNESATYVGLKNAGLEALAKDCANTPAAQVFINTEAAFPHVPSKWENAVLSVRLRAGQREYLGNLGNLRQLFFDKVLTAQMKFSDFSLQDRQIIRFLAINGEAENSNVLLNSELTSEFFHMLGDFPRFFRNGRRVIVHNQETAHAVVLVRSRGNIREYSPGIEFKNALLEINSAKVITGKSGCWIGKNGEYFFIAGDCEVGFLRNFFRLGKWSADMPGCAEFLKNMPFKLCRCDSSEPAEKPAAMVLDGVYRNDQLELSLNFVYDNLSFPPDAGRLSIDRKNNFFLRQEMTEAQITANLRMLKVSGDIATGKFAISDTESIGVFLNDLLPDWIKRYKELSLSGRLAQLANGGNQLDSVELECRTSGVNAEQNSYLVNYRWRSANGGSASWSEIMNGASSNSAFVKLSNGRLARLAGSSDIVKLGKLVKNLDENNSSFELPYMYLHYYRHLVRHWQSALPAALGGGENSASLPVVSTARQPLEFKAELRSYQREGFEWMRQMLLNNFNVILADEMGLGKTVQALSVFNELRQYSNAPSLVICPASLVENWARECAKFIPACRVGMLYGSNRGEVAKNLREYDLIITSYTMARREGAKLAKVNFDLLILDEAQHIKNPGTANAHSCKNLKAAHKLVLTGTPLENSPEDLWSIFDFLHPNLLGSFNAFKKEYANIGESQALRDDLAARTAPFIKRRVKSAVAPELPPREELNWFCTMEPAQRELYEKVRTEGRESLARLEKENGKNARGNMEVLTTLLRLRQICCHPGLIGEKEAEAAEIASAKFELMQELLLEHIDSGHKVLLFSQFTSLLSIVRQYLDENKIKYSYLDGATRNRQDVVDEFNNNQEIGVFLLSLKAGGTGLNLTSADTVMIYDPWWNPAAELQATDRTHRIGQTRPVRSIKLLVKDSIEEKILALQERKREIFEQVVENPALSGEKFTLEDLKFLLS